MKGDSNMKKTFLHSLFIIISLFTFSCACQKEKTVKKEEAIEVLKETKISGNVEVKTTTETIINEVYSSSTQVDTYYEDKYFRISNAPDLTTKTWYGSINNTLYAFYYTKNSSNEEIKSSSKIDNSVLESIKNQLNSITNNLFDDFGNLIDTYTINATKKGNVYKINLSNNNIQESISYTIIIQNNKILKIIKENTVNDSVIKTIYEYNYNVNEFKLPTLSEYPLKTNE